MDMYIADLVFKTITSVVVSPEKDWIEFITEDERLRFNAIGDCCSHSWINSVEDLDSLIGQEVVEVVEKDMEDFVDEEPEKHEVLQVYNIDIITKKGTCTIDFRNDSNGYYGGYLEFDESNSVVYAGE